MSILMTEYKYRLGRNRVSTTKLIILFRLYNQNQPHLMIMYYYTEISIVGQFYTSKIFTEASLFWTAIEKSFGRMINIVT